MNYTDREGNNFNLIRMISAYMVIFAHATAIQGRGTDIVVRLTGQTHSGQMAVFVFTFLSGVFITKSAMGSNTAKFLKKRIQRLYPELTLCLIITIIIGGGLTTYSQFDYWTDPQTRKYFIANLLEIANEHVLPGVFEDHPYTGVNGVLWFITFEVRTYLVWALIKSLKLFDRKTTANITLLILLTWVICRPDTLPFLGNSVGLYGNVDFPQYTITFVLGALVYVNAETIHLQLGHVLLMAAVMWIFRHSTIAIWVWACGFITMALYFGTLPGVKRIKVKDLSYGIFLYGWPTGQLIYEMHPEASALFAAVLTVILATGIAYVSERVAYYIVKALTGRFGKAQRGEARNG